MFTFMRAWYQVKLDIKVWSIPVEAGGGGDGGERAAEEEEERAAAAARMHLIEVRRKEGDPVLFHRVYQTIKAKVWMVG